MRKQHITYELDRKLSPAAQDEIMDILQYENARNIVIDYQEENEEEII